MPPLSPIMFVGTGSDVGKSVINAAFCRILKQDGYSPAPFKAQNMSLNSFATPDGLEIGRAQAMQAEACGLACQVEMNPLLLKPVSNAMAQVVLNGKPIGNQSAMEFFNGTDRDYLFAEVMKSYQRLASKFNPVVIEGAGSISEMNLRDRDIVNMRVALTTGAATYLIADIDRGGVFGSLYGTMQLLPEAERKLIKGIIINKFRGDARLFEDGRRMLEDLCKIPVVSVIPHFRDIYLDDEDSVTLDKKTATLATDKVNIAIVLLPHMSNFTDFNLLERMPGVQLFYSSDAGEIDQSDIVLLPGSKNTIADLHYLRKNGLAKAVIERHAAGKPVFGICGGYQMMGREIHDPQGLEGAPCSVPGLGILPVTTTLTAFKTTQQRSFSFMSEKSTCAGYEIHMGETTSSDPSPLCRFDDGTPDGYYLNDATWGTYLHGIFDNEAVLDAVLKRFKFYQPAAISPQEYKDEQYNKLANLVREHTDMNVVYKSLTQG